MNPSSETILNQNTENQNMNLENHHSYVRKRTRATAEQLAVLEDTFAVNVSPNSKLRKQLAEQLNMSERSIQIWFQNRRAKVKHMQKRAQMQMQQAAMRAQLYHYHQQQQQQQQQYSMMSAYGPPAPPPPPPMLPLQPSLYSPHHPQQPTPQQPFYFSPAYLRRIPPLPRAQSVDAVAYYGSPSADISARSSFPTTVPEPFMPHESLTPSPPHLNQSYSISNGAPGTWSVPPPNYHLFDNASSPIKLSRQSMPPYNPLSHTFMDDVMTPSEFTSSHPNTENSNSKQILSEDFPDFVHGQISPSPSPNHDDNPHSASYFSPTKDDSLSNLNVKSTEEEGMKGSDDSFDDKKVSEDPTAALTETDMWISSPNIESRSAESIVDNVTSSSSIPTVENKPSEEEPTVNPSNLIMTTTTTDNSPTLENEDITQEQHLNATTLTIGTWHRLKLQSSDLICLYKFEQRTLYVEVPISNIVSIEFTPSSLAATGVGEAITSDIHFYITQPPLFYMETRKEKDEKEWIQCSDFTENKQASRYLRHTLKGPQLKQDLIQLMNKREELRKLIRFLDEQTTTAATATTAASASATTVTPLLPSQQQQATMIVPSAAAAATTTTTTNTISTTTNYYPYYYYPSGLNVTTPMSLSLNGNPSSIMANTEQPPVPCGGFYS
ncbi:uncharacterized protein BX663DRAFT_518844 [Cokeromyces recurvatus]|uniref:uncharacterized protein n=1 Tax=Cokeromyces recurvatus TaxID=90255 RepID=UPI00221F6B79|nr:uncharacterized protein BX663DRAFT_518844 [Cokeromyces recurvatus]KAI7900174.1 hypothetical protein BX663DRAFT_518844 [Cokeromyces recurvatus]